MRDVVWSEGALRDLQDQFEFIAAEDEAAAEAVNGRVVFAAERLGKANTGRLGRIDGIYEKSVSNTSYVIAYSISGAADNILRVIHTARDWPRGGWPKEG
jgi:toxin ParE1/3/4